MLTKNQSTIDDIKKKNEENSNLKNYIFNYLDKNKYIECTSNSKPFLVGITFYFIEDLLIYLDLIGKF